MTSCRCIYHAWHRTARSALSQTSRVCQTSPHTDHVTEHCPETKIVQIGSNRGPGAQASDRDSQSKQVWPSHAIFGPILWNSYSPSRTNRSHLPVSLRLSKSLWLFMKDLPRLYRSESFMKNRGTHESAPFGDGHRCARMSRMSELLFLRADGGTNAGCKVIWMPPCLFCMENYY